MAEIKLTTAINAPIGRCFDLSRSVDLHMISTAHTNEKAIAGVTKGLMNKGDTVTWQATHLGVRQKLTVTITAMEYPRYFRDEMVKGAFKSMGHNHYFEEQNGQTIMTDVFVFESPFGFIGSIFNTVFLRGYMERFLVERNRVIKAIAEGEDWKKLLS